MNKKELVKSISNEINLNQKDVEKCIDKLSEIIIAKNSIGEWALFIFLLYFQLLSKIFWKLQLGFFDVCMKHILNYF